MTHGIKTYLKKQIEKKMTTPLMGPCIMYECKGGQFPKYTKNYRIRVGREVENHLAHADSQYRSSQLISGIYMNPFRDVIFKAVHSVVDLP